MIDPIIFYAIRRHMYRDDEIIAITSEVQSICYGISEAGDGASTSCASRSVLGRFSTKEGAVTAQWEASKVIAKYAPDIATAEMALAKIKGKRQVEIDETLKGDVTNG